MSTTSLLLAPLASDSHLPSGDQAKLKNRAGGEVGDLIGGSPVSGWRQMFDTESRVTT